MSAKDDLLERVRAECIGFEGEDWGRLVVAAQDELGVPALTAMEMLKESGVATPLLAISLEAANRNWGPKALHSVVIDWEQVWGETDISRRVRESLRHRLGQASCPTAA